jgi:hypothetical protein
LELVTAHNIKGIRRGFVNSKLIVDSFDLCDLFLGHPAMGIGNVKYINYLADNITSRYRTVLSD